MKKGLILTGLYYPLRVLSLAAAVLYLCAACVINPNPDGKDQGGQETNNTPTWIAVENDGTKCCFKKIIAFGL